MLILQRKMMSRPIILLLLDQCAQLTFSAMVLLYVTLDWGIHANIVSVTQIACDLSYIFIKYVPELPHVFHILHLT